MNTKQEETRPVARVLARELDLAELSKVSGGEVFPGSKSGYDPLTTGDWDDHH